MNGIEAVTKERWEQQAEHGHTVDRDVDRNKQGELIRGAMSYAELALKQVLCTDEAEEYEGTAPATWPWGAEEWKPSRIAKNNLKKAAAMLCAEWDRIDTIGG